MRPMFDRGRGDDDQESTRNNAHPPRIAESYIDALKSTSLNLSDTQKHTLLQNIGYLFGVCIDGIDGPRRSVHPVAGRARGSRGSPIREVNTIITETITTRTEREANYVHQGWTLDACSALLPWISARIASKNRPNPEGVWITKRTIAQRLSLNMQLEELVAAPEFEAGIEAALQKPTIFEQFKALYRVLHVWGDVVPLGIDISFSLSFTDLESNIVDLPNTGSYIKIRDLLAIRTLQVLNQGGNNCIPEWNDEGWPSTNVPAYLWSQVRVTRVVPTINMLSEVLQERVAELYAKRLVYVPILAAGTTGGYKTFDDNRYASKTPSQITVRDNVYIDSLSITYLDHTQSDCHGGGGGVEHQFTLADGEHITDMMVWSDREWVWGIQFRTTTGRISPHYGGTGGTPAVARCKGGVLTGFSSMTKGHGEFNNVVIARVRGIWRRDLVNKVPNEEDTFSAYFGSGGGIPFNDWEVFGNNPSMHVLRVDMWYSDLVYSIQLTYIDRSNGSQTESATQRHGGSEGTKTSFTLDPGETIVTIFGRYSDHQVEQLGFETNRGRRSGPHGGPGGEYFSVSAPLDNQGNRMRLRYICGKSGTRIDGIMFIWTPM